MSFTSDEAKGKWKSFRDELVRQNGLIRKWDMSKSGDAGRSKRLPLAYKYAAEMSFMLPVIEPEITVDNEHQIG